MSDINSISISGRIATDVELKKTRNGNSLVNLSIAVETYNKDYKENKAMFIGATIWRQNAEFVSRYGKKGDTIFIQGRLDINEYEDANKVKHKHPNIVVETLRLCQISKMSSPKTSDTENTFADIPDYSNIEIAPEEVPF